MTIFVLSFVAGSNLESIDLDFKEHFLFVACKPGYGIVCQSARYSFGLKEYSTPIIDLVGEL